MKADGLLEQVPAAAQRAYEACQPADHNRLTDRLTALGMMLSPNRPPAEARVWLGEMCRLLRDLPEDILAAAIDQLVRTSKFLPTCSEIRELADPEMERRRKAAAQIDSMRRYLESGQLIPALVMHEPPTPKPAEPPCTPEEAAAIMEEMGLPSATRAALRRHLGPPRKPTRADYIAMGVDPATLDNMPDQKVAMQG